MKIKDLNEEQRSHMAWRLDKHTCIGYLTACAIARMEGEWADKTVEEVFEWGDATPHSAKIQATKCKNFSLTESQRAMFGYSKSLNPLRK